MVRADLATDAALALDAAALIGTGAGANQPTGILNTTNVQQFTLAGDTGAGAVPTYPDICEMEELISIANADTLASFGFATTPPIRTKL
ncbi:MAG TPA: phage major capsid protein [Candidatus Sulfotelmatobacter sp.]|nr:phage major capsid protein [Candidatus Sulfotelmatobacter sp.]